MSATKQVSNSNFSFSSSIAADVAHPQKDPKSYEWWYFDAISDDGREAVVIIFLDNFVFSPRYNFRSGSSFSTRIPAISFVYYRDGKPVYRAVNEYTESEFQADPEKPGCTIGENNFTTEFASYGSGYLLTVNANLSRRRKLTAKFEWVSIEADLTPERCQISENSHCWNMVAPRSDVSGNISVFDHQNKESDVRHFRGTGYHDHNLDHRWLPETVTDWHWGRVHFTDATAVYYRYSEIGAELPETKLLLIIDGVLQEFEAAFVPANVKRDKFGIKYPARLEFTANDGKKLIVENRQIIDSSFFYLRFLSDFTLITEGEQRRHSIGITEYLAPAALKKRWLNWLINMRIGRSGKGAFLS